MKYFLDTEFLEGPQKEKFPISLFRKNTPPTIDLISIGIVAEDGREYYAISKDFNLEEAWNRYDLVQQSGDMRNLFPEGKKVYWIRENVLKPIYLELRKKIESETENLISSKFCFKDLKCLINRYGKTNKEIAEEVRDFVMETGIDYGVGVHRYTPIEFYAYYADYDWVVFCWLFGKMMDLPIGFPMYCKDLKQDFDFYNNNFTERSMRNALSQRYSGLKNLKEHPDYPKQDPSKSHNAIEDARWNKQLFDFFNKM